MVFIYLNLIALQEHLFILIIIIIMSLFQEDYIFSFNN